MPRSKQQSPRRNSSQKQPFNNNQKPVIHHHYNTVNSSQSPQSGSGLMGSLATGMAMGTGSAIAHTAINSLVGKEHQQVQQQQQVQQSQYNPCEQFSKLLINCLKQNYNETSICQSYIGQLTQCEKYTFKPEQGFQL